MNAADAPGAVKNWVADVRPGLRPALAGFVALGLFICALEVFAAHGRAAGVGAFAGALVAGLFYGIAFAAPACWVTVWLSSSRAKAAATPLGVDLAQRFDGVLRELEATRVALSARIDRRLATRLPLAMAASALFWGWNERRLEPPGLGLLLTAEVLGWMFGYIWASGSLSTRYKQAYKTQVLPRLAAEFGALDYRPAVCPDTKTLRQQELLPHFDNINADDEVFGQYRGLAISIIELKATEEDGDNTRTVFDGLLTRVTLPRTLSGATAVIAKEGMIGVWRDKRRGRQQVALEDPRFAQFYTVLGADQIAARALLTPAFMERFLALGDRAGFRRPTAIAEDNQLTIALPKQALRDLFEPPSWSEPAASDAALVQLHDDIAAVLSAADAVIDLDQFSRAAAG